MRRCLVLFAVAACGDDGMTTMPDAFFGTPSIAGTPVSSFESTSCATSVVLALSVQVAEEVDCLMTGQLVPFAESATIEFTGSAVLPYLSEVGRAALLDAVAAGGGTSVQITSAFRTVAQQYLLRRWFELGRCGITAAAEPGRSNHESGRALDISNYSVWIATFDAHGWSHDVPGDPVHFDHRDSPDIRGADIMAFQRLWNRNAPGDPIAEDGSYGPMTEERLKRAPAEGFGIGAICGIAGRAPVVNVDPGTPWSTECAD